MSGVPSAGFQAEKGTDRLPKRHGKLALHAAAGRFDEDEKKGVDGGTPPKLGIV